MKKFLKIILIILGVLLLLFGILVGYIIVDTSKQEKLLDQEMMKLEQLDLVSEKIDTKIVTKDEYAIIEKTIKNYLKEYSDNYNDFMLVVLNFNYEDMFTANTFQTDGPDFIVSKGKLSNLQKNVEKDLNKLIEMTDEKYITNLITSKNLDDYYVQLYNDYMFGTDVNSFKEEIQNTSEELKQLSNSINLFLDDCYKIYDFMSSNRNSWQIADNMVYFYSQNLLDEYNRLINQVINDSYSIIVYEDEKNEELKGI